MYLHNRINSEELKTKLHNEKFIRQTISFYRYFILDNLHELRDQLYYDWLEINCFGRIYIAKEGINAQMSVPENRLEAFFHSLKKYPVGNRQVYRKSFSLANTSHLAAPESFSI